MKRAVQEAASVDVARKPRDTDVQIADLRAMLQEILSPPKFKIGDLVIQRRDSSRYNVPKEGEIAIVSKILTEPLPARPADGTPYTREDMVILAYAEDTWVEFSVESFRFTLFEGAPKRRKGRSAQALR